MQRALTSRQPKGIAGRLRRYGAVAQLVERLVRNEEVRGSIPLSSTIRRARRCGVFAPPVPLIRYQDLVGEVQRPQPVRGMELAQAGPLTRRSDPNVRRPAIRSFDRPTRHTRPQRSRRAGAVIPCRRRAAHPEARNKIRSSGECIGITSPVVIPTERRQQTASYVPDAPAGILCIPTRPIKNPAAPLAPARAWHRPIPFPPLRTQ